MKTGAIISKAELSRQLGVTKARISQLVALGMPTLSDGSIDRQAVLVWIEANSSRPNRSGKVKRDGVLDAAVKLLAAERPSSHLAIEAGDDRFDRVLDLSVLASGSCVEIADVLLRHGVSDARAITDEITAAIVGLAGRFCDDLVEEGEVPAPIGLASWSSHTWFILSPMSDLEWGEAEAEARA